MLILYLEAILVSVRRDYGMERAVEDRNTAQCRLWSIVESRHFAQLISHSRTLPFNS